LAKLSLKNREPSAWRLVKKYDARRKALNRRDRDQTLPMEGAPRGAAPAARRCRANANPTPVAQPLRAAGRPRGTFPSSPGAQQIREGLRGDIPAWSRPAGSEEIAAMSKMSDPIADMLTRIRNAQRVEKTEG